MAHAIDAVPRFDAGGEGRDLAGAVQQGYDYVAHAASARALQSRIGLDASFDATIQLRDLRAFVQAKLGADLGFDAGDETFSSMIALKLFVDDRAAHATVAQSVEVARKRVWHGRYHFFCDECGFAADTDCTGIASAALYEAGVLTKDELVASAEELLKSAAAASEELRTGVVMVYWEDGHEPRVAPRGRKQDAAAAANALYALKLATEEAGLDDPRGVIAATQAYVADHLRSGAYLAGTRYYPSPDTFLYYVSCLCQRFPDCIAEFGSELRRALERRHTELSKPGSADDRNGPLNIAQRALAAYHVGADIDLREDLEKLAAMQRSDGSWPAAPFYSLGRWTLYFGSRAVTTMFVVKAMARALQEIPEYGGIIWV